MAGNGQAEAAPEAIAVAIAYEVRRGNAFNKYEKWDFNLGKKPVVITAVAAEYEADGNSMMIRPTSKDSLVEVTGFDPHRDLAIRALPKKEETPDAEEV